ncbi:MAG: insulinase family protein [Pseudonocardia sp.]|nr:insulinase family protein [Pseudonocardia sp.]
MLAPPGSVSGGASVPAPDLVRHSLLPSGLQVVTEVVPGARSVSVGVWIGVGSRDETTDPTADETGAAHYLEHLLFKGTARRTATQIAEEVDAVGGELNAFTGKEHTCFHGHVLDVDLPLAVDLLTDVVTAATMIDRDVELERAVVLEEIAMRADDPQDLLGEVFDAALFGDHSLGRPVIGSEESIKAMTRSRLRDFWRRHYTPDRVVVAAAGNLEHDRVVGLVARSWPAESYSPVRPEGRRLAPMASVGARRLAILEQDTEQAHLMVGMRGLDQRDPRRPAFEVLNAVLGGGVSSRLFQQVREQRGLAYSVYSATSSYSDAGQLAVYAGCRPDRLGDVVTVMRGVLDDVLRDGLTEAEVTRAKGSLRGALILGLEDSDSRMQRIGCHQIDLGHQRSLAESLAAIEAVSPAEIVAVADQVLRRPLTVAVVGPFETEADLPSELRRMTEGCSNG